MKEETWENFMMPSIRQAATLSMDKLRCISSRIGQYRPRSHGQSKCRSGRGPGSRSHAEEAIGEWHGVDVRSRNTSETIDMCLWGMYTGYICV